jgi:hypothetical protein
MWTNSRLAKKLLASEGGCYLEQDVLLSLTVHTNTLRDTENRRSLPSRRNTVSRHMRKSDFI